jgi:hypothetical protein
VVGRQASADTRSRLSTAAERAGASTVAVMTGRFSSEELVDAGAVGVLESISELGTALDHKALDRAVARRDDECDLSDTCSASPVRDVRS